MLQNASGKVKSLIILQLQKMSSNSLISSLFRDNSFTSRSSSLFSKNFSHQQTSQERSRSQSIARNKSVDNDGSNRNHPLNRLAHIFSVKIKKHNYFLFCRLEANWKKYKSEKNKEQNSMELNTPKPETNEKIFIKNGAPSANMIKGIQGLADTFLLINEKKNQCNNLQLAFRKLVKKSLKLKGFEEIFRLLSKQKRNLLRQGTDSIIRREKLSLKMQILRDAVEPFFGKIIRTAFGKVRQFAIDVMVQEENKRRQEETQKEEELKINLNKQAYNPQFHDLKEISEEESDLVSQEETARFTTQFQEQTRRSSEDITFRHLRQFEVDSAITPRKDSRREKQSSYSNKKQKYFLDEQNSQFSVQCAKNEQEKKKIFTRQTTKAQARRQPIIFSKALKVETILEENDVIERSIKASGELEKMKKAKNLFPQNIPETIADHDNITLFQERSSNRGTIRTANTMKTNEDRSYSARGSTNLFGKAFEEPQVNEFDEDGSIQIGYFGSRKQRASFDEQILSSPKFGQQPHDGVRTPLTRIEQMMLDLEKISQNSKSRSKNYTTGYHKCKISVHLPKRNVESNHNSGSKYNHSGLKGNTIDWVSEKKPRKSPADNIKAWSIKDSKDHKQNIEVKLWDEKQKFLFYPDFNAKNKEKKKNSSGYISSMDHSLLNSARKTTTLMKKEIENIKKNCSKNKTSLGNLKLVRKK